MIHPPTVSNDNCVQLAAALTEHEAELLCLQLLGRRDVHVRWLAHLARLRRSRHQPWRVIYPHLLANCPPDALPVFAEAAD